MKRIAMIHAGRLKKVSCNGWERWYNPREFGSGPPKCSGHGLGNPEQKEVCAVPNVPSVTGGRFGSYG